jgi:simple sugar transport system permease protein
MERINFRKIFLNEKVIVSMVSILVSLVVAAIVIIFIGKSPLVAYSALFYGAFGMKEAIIDNLMKASPLILTGLAVGFGFRAGLFNIGANGQVIMGALLATYVGTQVEGDPFYLSIPLVIMAGMIGGALWAGIAGWLKAYRGAHEVITTIMLNYVAIYISNYVVNGPFQAPGGVPKSPAIAYAAQFPNIMTVGATSLSTILFVSLAAVVVIYIIIQKTTIGYEVKAVGTNPYAAEYGGISIGKNVVLAMMISGALAGLAGTTQVVGVYGRYFGALGGTMGFDGITIALIGQNDPVGIALAAFLISSIRTGSNQMQIAGVPKDMVTIIQGIIIFLVAANRIFKTMKFYRKRKEVEI